MLAKCELYHFFTYISKLKIIDLQYVNKILCHCCLYSCILFTLCAELYPYILPGSYTSILRIYKYMYTLSISVPDTSNIVFRGWNWCPREIVEMPSCIRWRAVSFRVEQSREISNFSRFRLHIGIVYDE